MACSDLRLQTDALQVSTDALELFDGLFMVHLAEVIVNHVFVMASAALAESESMHCSERRDTLEYTVGCRSTALEVRQGALPVGLSLLVLRSLWVAEQYVHQ